MSTLLGQRKKTPFMSYLRQPNAIFAYFYFFHSFQLHSPLTLTLFHNSCTGVYRDLISTMRKAPSQIPVVFGNLRQELLSERAQLRRRIRRCRDPHHVQITHKGLMTRLGPRKEEVLYLFQRTMRDLWTEFKNLERPFLVASGRRAESIQRGDYWGESDVEKVGGTYYFVFLVEEFWVFLFLFLFLFFSLQIWI